MQSREAALMSIREAWINNFQYLESVKITTQFYDWYNIIYIAGEYEDLIELNKEKHEQVSDSEEHDQHEKVPESEEHHQNSNEHSKGVIINESDNDNDDSKTIEPYEQQQNKQYKNENQGT